MKKAREKRRLGEVTLDEAGFTPAFFKKTDNIRDLFYNNDDLNVNQELGTIQIVGDDKDFKRVCF